MFEVPMTNFSDYTVSSYNTKKQISGNLKGVRNENQLNDQCSPSYRNQSNDLQSRSIEWFLCDGEHWSLMG